LDLTPPSRKRDKDEDDHTDSFEVESCEGGEPYGEDALDETQENG